MLISPQDKSVRMADWWSKRKSTLAGEGRDFKNGFKGGVHVITSPKEAREVAEKMLGQTLVTHQTGSDGRVVNKVLVGESAEIAREIYFAILLDRTIAAPLIVASTEGGVEIETVAANRRTKLFANQSIRWPAPTISNTQTRRSNSDSSNRKQRRQ